MFLLDLNAKSVVVQEKAPTHLHDATFADTPDRFYTASHNSIGVYEIKPT